MQQHEIKAKREATGLTQQELGERIGLSKSSARILISAYEAGSTKDKPTGARLDQIAAALTVAARIKAYADKEWQKYREKFGSA